MLIEDLEIQSRPFQTCGHPDTFVRCHCQQDADEFLQRVLTDKRGVGELVGPEKSGKTTIVNQFVKGLPADVAVAVIDGRRIGGSELLGAALAQFGYKAAIELNNDLLGVFKKFVVQELHTDRMPLLVVENVDKLHASGLQILCALAALTVHQQFLLRLVLVNRSPLSDIIDAPTMAPIRARLVGTFELRPLSARETLKYLHTKFRGSGVVHAHHVLPIATCVELHKQSGGWPGELDRLTLRAVERAEQLPIRPEHIHPKVVHRPSRRRMASLIKKPNADSETPRLLVTSQGKLLQEFEVKQPKVLIGRACLNDVVLNNQYVSKYHASLIFNNNTMYLVDLKSANGIYINSHRVRSTVLRHDDVIGIGTHRIKVSHPSSRVRAENPDFDATETSIMKTVMDMRRAVADKFLRVVPAKWNSHH